MPDPPLDTGPERYIRVDHLSGDLRGRSVRGGVVTLANQAGKFTLTVLSTAVLARLLTPEDFGLIAMVLAVVGFIQSIKDMGLSMATVQRPDLNHGQVSTLFWLNLALSVAIVLVVMSLSPLLAWFYREPRLARVTVVIGLSVLFGGLTLQLLALLRRQMRFGLIAAIEVSAMFVAAAAAVLCALAGLGYWSLVVLIVSKEAAMAIGVWAACRWRPGRPVRNSGVGSMVSFGAHLTAFNVVNYFARNLDKILLGRFAGAAALGLYNKAYQFLLIPIQQINTPVTSVAVPTLSRLQGDLERYRAYYRRGVLLTVAIGMPAVAFLFVSADKVVLTLLGSQWVDSVAIFRALGPAAFIGTFNVATGWVYVSLGRTDRQFRWGLFATAVIVIAYAIGIRWGPIGVGVAFSASLVLLRYPAIIYCFRKTHLRIADLATALWRPWTASIAAGAALYAVDRAWLRDIHPGVGLVVDFILYAAFYILIWIALPGGRASARDIVGLTRELRRGATPRPNANNPS